MFAILVCLNTNCKINQGAGENCNATPSSFLMKKKHQKLNYIICNLQFLPGLNTPAAKVLATRKQIDVLDSQMSYLDTGKVAGSDETGKLHFRIE